MRKLVIASAVVCAFAAPALAGPKDKTKGSLIGPQAVAGNATVNNATTDFSYATKGCKLQVKAKGLTAAEGAKIICIGGADVLGGIFAVPAGNSIVTVGEVSGGQLKLKGDLTEIGCGGPLGDVIQFNGSFDCYADDVTYRSTDAGAGSWAAACVTGGGAALVNTTAAPDELKNTPGQRVVVGVCQGFSAGIRIDPPASSEIAVIGSRQFPIP